MSKKNSNETDENDVAVDEVSSEDALADAKHSKVGYNRKNFNEDVRFFCIFISLFAFFRFFIYDYFIIPSSSMYPTLLIGDMPLVEKWAYGYSKHSIWFSPSLFSGRVAFRRQPKRGEVVVFKAPEDNDTNVIKRVIAVPGDKISVTDGIICVNGEKAQLTYKEDRVYYDTNQRTRHVLSLYEEKLPLSDAPIHTVAYYGPAKGSDANHFPEYTVQEGEYFVMGDNRDFSKDSRCGLGRVPQENLMGRAVRKIYSIDNGVKLWEPWLWLHNIRYSRIFKEII
ncbi:signal peptidase I [Alphaproteobacteria bacterium]|nr:signal peptidase I [Alphaproteobacteria bacterium]